MSRIRSIHPGLFTDEAFMSLSAHGRLLLIGIWTEAFDDGVFEWKPLTLKARIFPADNLDMDALLAELVAADCIRKESHNGKPIGLVRNFQKFQRPKKPNSSAMLAEGWRSYVGASGTDKPTSPPSSEPVGDQYGTGSEIAPQMEEGGGNKEDEDTPPDPPRGGDGAVDLFDQIWTEFPHNPGSARASARKQFDGLPPEDQSQAVAAAKRYRAWWEADCLRRKAPQGERLNFVPHLATWLKTGAWRDADSLPVPGSSSDPPVPMTKLDRDRDRDLWLRCEAVMGKPAPTSGIEWWFRDEVIKQAMREMVA